MKLKYIDVNGHGVLVEDEKTQVELNFLYYEKDNNIPIYSFTEETIPKEYFLNKVVFAEKELNLDVPKFNWRNWEIKQLAEQEINSLFFTNVFEKEKALRIFIAGYKSNEAKYTEDDLITFLDFQIEFLHQDRNNKLFRFAYPSMEERHNIINRKILENIVKEYDKTKLPKYIVIKTKSVCRNCNEDKNHSNYKTCNANYYTHKIPFFTNNNKAVITEIIY